MYPSIPASDGILLSVALITTGDKEIVFIKPLPGALPAGNITDSGSKVISGIR